MHSYEDIDYVDGITTVVHGCPPLTSEVMCKKYDLFCLFAKSYVILCLFSIQKCYLQRTVFGQDVHNAFGYMCTHTNIRIFLLRIMITLMGY